MRSKHKNLLIGLLSLTLLCGTACSGSEEESEPGCSIDSDCKGDRICQDGACVGGASESSNTNPGPNNNTSQGPDNSSQGPSNASQGPSCSSSSDCEPITCPCKESDASYAGCIQGQCASMTQCTDVCADKGGVRDTNCTGDFSLGSIFYTTSDSIIGNACDDPTVPKNCWTGEYIKFSDGTCICTPFCDRIGEGANCTDNGDWTCQRVRSNNGSNRGLLCTYKDWNLCGE